MKISPNIMKSYSQVLWPSTDIFPNSGIMHLKQKIKTFNETIKK